MPDIITPPDVPGTHNKMLLWVLGLVAGGIVFAASWVGSRMSSDADFTRKLVEQANAERGDNLKALTLLSENVRQSSDQTRALVISSELTNKWLEKIAKDQEAGAWRGREPTPPSPSPVPKP